MNVTVVDLGLKDYKETWDYQEDLFQEIVRFKEAKQAHMHNKLLFVQHPHVYTLGRSGVENNLLINKDFLDKIDATFYKINRGGDITYHGPGQIVGYPIIDLEQLGIGIKDYVFKLEEVIIKTLEEFGVKGDHMDSATGVWLDKNNPSNVRKICAIGVRSSKWVTMHGFALNVNTDLNYYNHINPCGFVDKGVTSVEKEIGKPLDVSLVISSLKRNFQKVFNVKLL